jgi:hypothetical protein
MKSRARVMLLIPHHGEEDDSFFDYHKSAAVAQSAKSEAR